MTVTPDVTLKRSIRLLPLALYGLGTTIGAGIFALIGKVAGEAGLFAPFAFVLALILAGLSALGYAELSARLPRAGGEVAFVHAGFRWSALSRLVGILILIAGTVSAAAIARAASGYLDSLFALTPEVWMVFAVAALGFLASWGISETVTVAALFTLVEIGTLGVVIASGSDHIPAYVPLIGEAATSLDASLGMGVITAAFLAFYAFLGFEDIVNVAEETRNAERALPAAILITLIVSCVLYVSLSIVAVSALPPETLAGSPAPMAEIFAATTRFPAAYVAAASVVALLNGALVQLVKCARILYGMSQEGLLPRALGVLAPGRRTPMRATVLVAAVVLGLALGFPVEDLAAMTSAVTLTIFIIANLSLLRIKRAGGDPDHDGFRVPAIIPLLAVMMSVAFVIVGIAGLVGS